MSNTPEITPEITPEMFAAYQRQQAEIEQATAQAAMRECISQLVTYASEHGFEIIALPKIQNGLLVAVWGLQRKAA